MTLNPLLKQASDDRNLADEVGMPFVSVILPVRNEERFIEATLHDLLRQQYDPRRFEVIVVDGESTDSTRELVEEVVKRHSNVRLLRNPRRLASAARNIGIRAAQGDIMLIVDGHCEIEDDQHFSKLAAAFSTSGADCIGRPQSLDVSEASTLQRAIAAARESRLGHHPESYIYSSEPRFTPAKSVAVAYRRSVFDAVGYFDENFDAHEDGEFNYRIDRAGLRCYFTPEISVKYCPRGDLKGLFRQMVRYGRGRIRLMRKHRNSTSIGTLVPAAFVLGLIAGLPLSFVSPWLAGIYAGTIMLYVGIVLLCSSQIALRSSRFRLQAWLPFVFLAVHIGSGTGLLLEFATARQTVDPKAES